MSPVSAWHFVALVLKTGLMKGPSCVYTPLSSERSQELTQGLRSGIGHMSSEFPVSWPPHSLDPLVRMEERRDRPQDQEWQGLL